MRELLVLRHAEAEAAAAGEHDRTRGLSAHGEAQARGVGLWLAAQGMCPDSVVCSSVRRARATAALVLDAWPAPPEPTWLDAIYGATPAELLALLERHATGQRVLLIGHNPGIRHLVALLCRDLSPDYAMPPGSLARIVRDGPVKPGHGRLDAFRAG